MTSAGPRRNLADGTSSVVPPQADRDGRRVLLSLIDQGVNSLCNALVTVAGAILLIPADFASLSIAVIVSITVLVIVRALSSETLLLVSRQDEGAETAALGFVLMTAIPLAAVLVVLGSTVDDLSALALISAFVPFLLVQDLGRFVSFRRGLPTKALTLDIVWLVVQSLVIVSILNYGLLSVSGLILAWGMGLVISSLISVHYLWRGTLPRASRAGVRWLREQGRTGALLAGQTVAGAGAVQVAMLITGLSQPATEFGALRVVQLVFVPLVILASGPIAYMTPRLVASSRAERRNLARSWAFLGGAVATAYTVTIVLTAPLWQDRLRGDYGDLTITAALFGAAGSAMVLAIPAAVLMRIAGSHVSLLLAQCATGLVLVVSMPAGTAALGAPGAAAAMLLCNVALAITILVLRFRYQRSANLL